MHCRSGMRPTLNSTSPPVPELTKLAGSDVIAVPEMYSFLRLSELENPLLAGIAVTPVPEICRSQRTSWKGATHEGHCKDNPGKVL